ncbi:MAG: WecB/TagA/CpsF family glycosyltransferase [Calditrichaeota bacterium]|nr:WecB/TagA/CpsF family glycosyltransferase [Calditrichota bacterium]
MGKNIEQPPREAILGCRISVTPSYEAVYDALRAYLANGGGPGYITVNNVHTVVEGARRDSYRAIINRAVMAFPDGRPLSLVMEWRGIKDVERIFGPSFFEKALTWSEGSGLKHFLFGSSPETLARLQAVCRERFPQSEVVGAISPPFRPLSAEENREYLAQINASGADIVWVGLGAPRQEEWMAANYRQLNRGLMIGIGAGFDYLAGNTRHAPAWMKKYALEWLYRLIQEPRRLWKRYLVTNSLFVIFLALEWMGVKRFD